MRKEYDMTPKSGRELRREKLLQRNEQRLNQQRLDKAVRTQQSIKNLTEKRNNEIAIRINNLPASKRGDHRAINTVNRASDKIDKLNSEILRRKHS